MVVRVEVLILDWAVTSRLPVEYHMDPTTYVETHIVSPIRLY